MDLNLKIDKPVLVVGSGFSGKINTKDFFVLSSGKSLHNLDYVDVVISIDLIRIIHNISNFRKKWGLHLVPHRITNTQWFGLSSGIMQRKSGEIIYLKSPVHSLMFFKPEDFVSFNRPKGFFNRLGICCDSLSYEDADKIIKFSKYRIKKFFREDTENLRNFAKKDGALRNSSSSIHLILNLLWLNGIKEINTLGITEDHDSWKTTNQIIKMYGMNYKRIENDTYFT